MTRIKTPRAVPLKGAPTALRPARQAVTLRRALHLPLWVGQAIPALGVLTVWLLFGLSPYALLLTIPLLMAGQWHQKHWLNGEATLGARDLATAALRVAPASTRKPRTVPIVYEPGIAAVATPLEGILGSGRIAVDAKTGKAGSLHRVKNPRRAKVTES